MTHLEIVVRDLCPREDRITPRELMTVSQDSRLTADERQALEWKAMDLAGIRACTNLNGILLYWANWLKLAREDAARNS